jgi:hypothetical protein
MSATADMKHTAFDIAWKGRRIRGGSCVMWATVIIVLAYTGHLVLAAPVSVAGLLQQWLRK